MNSTETEIAALMAKRGYNRKTAVMVLRLEATLPAAEQAKRRASEAAHDATAKRIFDNVMTDLGCSI